MQRGFNSAQHARSSVRAAAAGRRKKPGRVAGKQSGATYYQNYLRNRQALGGQFLGPPLQLLPDGLDDTRQQQQEQQEQEQQQQQEQEHGQQGQPGVGSPAAAATPPADPAELQQLLEACLKAAVPTQQQTQQQQQQQVPCSPLELQQQRTKQRAPCQLPDYVDPTMADTLVGLVKRKAGGVTVHAPDIPAGEGPLIPLPPLPALYVNTSTSTTSTTTSSTPTTPTATTSGSSSSSATSPIATTSSSSGSSGSSSTTTTTTSSSSTPTTCRRRLLHVFWDLSSLHPAGYDPRVLVAQLRRVLGSYGHVAGVYAYGIQKLFNWVPEAFMLQYAPDRLPGRRREQQQQQQPTLSIQSQQQDVQQLLQQAAQAGVSLEDSLGPLRCRVCGKLRDSYRQLHVHMLQRHKQAAPPLEKLLPEGALAAMVAAAIAAAAAPSPGGSSDGSSAASGRQQQQQRQPSDADRPAPSPPPAAAAAAAGGRSSFTWRVEDPFAMRNSSTRTLGRVRQYFNSQGQQFIPPDGHQISLKYVLVREGVEVRTVQRQARAVSAAVADALHNTLHGELLARSAQEVQEVQDVLVVVSDKGMHAAVLQEARRAGVPCIAVCGKLREYVGADVTLRWQWVAAGRYDLHNATDKQ